VQIPDAIRIDSGVPDIREQIAALPNSAGIYLLEIAGKPPHLSSSVNLKRRLLRLLVADKNVQAPSLGRLRDALLGVQCWATGSRLESSLLLYSLAQKYYPGQERKRLRLRPPWFIGFNSPDLFPHLATLGRIPRQLNLIFGPFRTREVAQHYEEEIESLFQIRRCTEALTPSPDHPGCIYGEMKQCLRPCQSAVTREEYASEAKRVAEFLADNGTGMVSSLTIARDRAAGETEFELAAQLHKRIEKIKSVSGVRPEGIAEIHQLNGVAVTRGLAPFRFRLWPMLEGYWQEPVDLCIQAEAAQTKSLDQQLRETLTRACSMPQQVGDRLDGLALFLRWFHSSWRDGDWLPFKTLADLNYRKLVRAVSKMAKDAAQTVAQ